MMCVSGGWSECRHTATFQIVQFTIGLIIATRALQTVQVTRQSMSINIRRHGDNVGNTVEENSRASLHNPNALVAISKDYHHHNRFTALLLGPPG